MSSRTPFVALSLIVGLVLAAGCGGGGGEEGPGEEIVETSLVRVVFPGPTGITDQSTIRIRGVAPDPSQVTNVVVDGQAALTVDDYATWSVDVALDAGLNVLDVDVTDGEGGVFPAHLVVRVLNVGHFPVTVRALALGSSGNRLFLADARLETLSAMNLTTGYRTVVSGGGVGGGTPLEDPEGLVLDPAGGAAYMMRGQQSTQGVVRIDLATGNRTLISANGIGSGTNLNDPKGLAFDVQNTRLVAADAFPDALRAIDLLTGDRTPLSDHVSVGGGDDFASPFDLVLDATGSTAWVSDRNDKVTRVNLLTGDRTRLADDDTGAGHDFQTVSGIVDDPAGDRVIVGDDGSGNGLVVAVDKLTGDRTILSSDDVGFGPELGRIIDLAPGALAGRVLTCENTDRILEVRLSTGERRHVQRDEIGSGEDLEDAYVPDVAYDPVTGAVLLLARPDGGGATRILRISPTTGERVVLSGPGVGSGAALDGATEMTLDVAGRRLFVFDWDTEALYAVALAGGDRTLISGVARGTGPEIPSAMDLLFDDATGTILLVTSNEDRLLEIDPASGDRTLLSDRTGFGPEWLVPSTLALDPAAGLVYVLDHQNPKTLFAVDRATGVRVVLTDSTMGTGILASAASMHLDAANGRLLLVRESIANASSPTTQAEVTALDLATGNRTIVSDPFVGVGPAMISPTGGAYDPATRRLFVSENRMDGVYVLDTRNPASFDRAILSR